MISTSEKVDLEGRSEAHGSQWILCGVGFLLSLCLGSGAGLVQQAYTASVLPRAHLTGPIFMGHKWF